MFRRTFLEADTEEEQQFFFNSSSRKQQLKPIPDKEHCICAIFLGAHQEYKEGKVHQKLSQICSMQQKVQHLTCAITIERNIEFRLWTEDSDEILADWPFSGGVSCW